MDEVQRGVDWSLWGMKDMFSSLEDEVDIIGEGHIDDIGEEAYVMTHVLTIHEDPIVECYGLSRLEWVTLEVVLLNKNNIHVVEGVCHNTHP